MGILPLRNVPFDSTPHHPLYEPERETAGSAKESVAPLGLISPMIRLRVIFAAL